MCTCVNVHLNTHIPTHANKHTHVCITHKYIYAMKHRKRKIKNIIHFLEKINNIEKLIGRLARNKNKGENTQKANARRKDRPQTLKEV